MSEETKDVKEDNVDRELNEKKVDPKVGMKRKLLKQHVEITKHLAKMDSKFKEQNEKAKEDLKKFDHEIAEKFHIKKNDKK